MSTELDQALEIILDLEKQLDAFAEPIAIIGEANRLPGGDLWDTLRSGQDCSRPTTTRWPSVQLPIERGSFIDRPEEFDAPHFNLPSIEAEGMDPQHRLFLQGCFEAMLRAGIFASRRTGVFAALMNTDHAERLFTAQMENENIGYFGANNNHFGTANRTSFALNLGGPSIAIDGACSGSLVAIHEACMSLRNGECDAALAGGINLMLSANSMIGTAALQAGSPDGRCKTFDASANGYGRGEGYGVVVLKRLSDAIRDGDSILAQVLGSATNHGGRTAGYSVPSSKAQAELISLAMKRANVAPDDVQYLEAHGTGTSLGDPIEIEGIVSSHAGRSTKLVVGSVKSNMGHLEAAAGVSGLLKVIAAIRHRKLPPNLHFRNPNPHIPWDTLPIKVQTELTPWPEPGRPLVAGISSFGFGGTNAHLIISEAPPEPEEKWAAADLEASRKDLLLPLALSAKVPKALREYAERVLTMLEGPDDETYYTTWRDLAHTSTVRRQHMEERLVVVGKSKDEWKSKLRSYLQGDVPSVAGNGKEARSRIVFVFSGQGPQWFAMGRELFNEPVFKRSIEECSVLAKKYSDWSIHEELLRDESASRLSDTAIAQPCIVALQISLVALFKHWGVSPSAIVGHSIGEVAACYAAGVFSLEETMRLAVVRGRIMRKATGLGKMASISLSEKELVPLLAGDTSVTVAATNSPFATVVSGSKESIDALLTSLKDKSVQAKELKVDYAFHSEQVAPFMQELEKELVAFSLSPKAPSTRIVSTYSGKEESDAVFTPAYWAKQMRERVRFLDATKTLIADDYDLFVEISAHSVLAHAIAETASEENTKRQRAVAVVPSLRRHTDDREAMLMAFASLHTHGYAVDWKKIFQDREGHYVWGRVAELPNYPWQYQRYWLPEKKEKRGHQESRWCFIHSHLESSSHRGEHTFQVELDLSDETYAYLKDHKVQGNIWLPGAGYIEMALEVGTELLANKFSGLAELALKEPMVLSETEPTLVQLTTSAPNDKGSYLFAIASKPKNDAQASWTVHATGSLSAERLTPGDMPRLQDVRARIKQTGNAEKTSQEFYSAFEDMDLSYGPAFQGLASLSPGNEEALAKLHTPETLSLVSIKGYRVHPSILDAAFQASTGALATLKLNQTFVPATCQHIRSVQDASSSPAAQAFAKLRSRDPKNISVDVYLLDKDGTLLTEVIGLGLKPVGQAQDKLDKWMWDVQWKTVPQSTEENLQGPWLIVEDSSGVGNGLRTLLEKKNQKVISTTAHFSDPDTYLKLFNEHFRSSPPRKIVHLAALDVADGLSIDTCKQSEKIACISTLFLIQAIQKMQAETWSSVGPKLFLVTRGAQPPVSSPAQAMLWGFGACIPHESPELESTLIDLSVDSTPLHLFHELTHHDRENRIALRSAATNSSGGTDGSERRVQRLERHRRNTSAEPYVFPPNVTVLISGGYGGLGPVIARKLAELGVMHIALVGRTGANSDAKKEIDAISEKFKTTFYLLKADISDVTEVEQLRRELENLGAPSVHTLVHAAAVLRDATLQNQSPKLFRECFAPKVDGLIYLLEVFPKIEQLINFASVAGLLGGGGQSNYAAANALLDASAHFRSERKQLSRSIDWGAWADVGAATSSTVINNLARQGITGITPVDGAVFFERILASQETQLSPFPIATHLWAKANPKLASTPLFGDSLSRHGGNKDVLRHLQSLVTLEERTAVLTEHITSISKNISGTTSISATTSFKEVGFDSLMVVSLKNRLEAEIGFAVPTGSIYGAVNIAALASDLARRVERTMEGAVTSQASATAAPTPKREESHADALSSRIATAEARLKRLNR